MKQYLYILSILLIASCARQAEKKHKDLNAEKIDLLEGYFVNNNVEFTNNTKHLFIDNQADFDKYFSCAKTMNNIISETNFHKFNVACILSKVSFSKENITNVEKKTLGNKLNVQYKLFKESKKSYSSSDLILFKIDKSITSICFLGTETISIK